MSCSALGISVSRYTSLSVMEKVLGLGSNIHGTDKYRLARRARFWGHYLSLGRHSLRSTATPICRATIGWLKMHFSVLRSKGSMTVFRNEGRWDNSNVEFANGRIFAYDKSQLTQQMHYIDYGLSVFQRSAFNDLIRLPADLSSVHEDLLRSDQLEGFEVQERFYEIGSFDGMNSLSERIERERRVGCEGKA